MAHPPDVAVWPGMRRTVHPECGTTRPVLELDIEEVCKNVKACHSSCFLVSRNIVIFHKYVVCDDI